MAETIWDAMTEGQRIKEDRERRAMEDMIKQDDSAASQAGHYAAANLNNANADATRRSQADQDQKRQAAAYEAIQKALQSGDVAQADYLSKMHFGKPIQDTTQLPQAPTPVEDPGATPDPQYGPAMTPDIAAGAKQTEVQNNGTLASQWLDAHPDAPDMPDTETMLSDLKMDAADKQRGRDITDKLDAQDLADRQGAYKKYQTDVTEYAPRLEAARARPQYSAGDMRFDPEAGDAKRSASFDEARKLAPDESVFTTLVQAAQKTGQPIDKSNPLLNAAAQSAYDKRAGLQAQKDAAAMERLRLANEGKLDVAHVRGAARGKGKGHGGADSASGYEEIAAAAERGASDSEIAHIAGSHGIPPTGSGGYGPQVNAIRSELNKTRGEAADFSKEQNLPLLQKRQKEIDHVLGQLKANPDNPMAQKMAIEKAVSIALGKGTTNAPLKLAIESMGGTMDNIEGVFTHAKGGQLPPGKLATFVQYLRGEGAQYDAQGKDAYDAFDRYVNESYNEPQKARRMHQRTQLFSNLHGFDAGQQKQGEKPTVGDQLVSGARKSSGKPAKSAEDMLDALVK